MWDRTASGTTPNGLRSKFGSVARQPLSPTNFPLALAMKIRFANHAAREALVLSIAGVTAIMLIESLILLIL
jgi:hypothetical protein